MKQNAICLAVIKCTVSKQSIFSFSYNRISAINDRFRFFFYNRIFAMATNRSTSDAHTLIVPSSLPEQTSCGPRLATFTELTNEPWPLMRLIRCPVLKSHKPTVLSVEAVNNVLK